VLLLFAAVPGLRLLLGAALLLVLASLQPMLVWTVRHGVCICQCLLLLLLRSMLLPQLPLLLHAMWQGNTCMCCRASAACAKIGGCTSSLLLLLQATLQLDGSKDVRL
jgi:uncharacterized membrane protein YqaE (UPF0057 family)